MCLLLSYENSKSGNLRKEIYLKWGRVNWQITRKSYPTVYPTVILLFTAHSLSKQS